MVDIKKLKVAELRAELEKRGLNTTGNKPDLVNRLQARLDEEEFGMEPTADPETPASKEDPSLKTDTPVEEEAKKEEEKAESNKQDPVGEGGKQEDPPPSASIDKIPAVDVADTAKTESDKRSFEELKKQRANRFKIPLVEAKKKPEPQHQKRKSRDGKKGKKQKDNQQPPDKRPKVEKKKEEPVIPKEEIEKRLKRLERFGNGGEEAAKLKTMLRVHRFSASE